MAATAIPLEQVGVFVGGILLNGLMLGIAAGVSCSLLFATMLLTALFIATWHRADVLVLNTKNLNLLVQAVGSLVADYFGIKGVNPLLLGSVICTVVWIVGVAIGVNIGKKIRRSIELRGRVNY